MTILPLDTWRAQLGLHPYHFWGLADTRYVPIVSKCSTLVYEYDWLGSDAAGRSSIRQAIDDAAVKAATYLGYRTAPEYVDYALVDWPQYYQANLQRSWDFDATGRRVAVQAPEGYVQAMGVESLTLLATANLTLTTYQSIVGAPYYTFSCTAAVAAGTDPNEIVAYFAAADRFDGPDFSSAVGARWRIEPINVSVAGLVATITGQAWLIAQPVLYEQLTGAALDPTQLATFVSTLEIYQRTTNGDGTSVTTAQSTLVYETNDCGACWGRCCCSTGTVSSDPGTTGEVIARAGIRDTVLGLITPAAATYDPSTGLWSSAWCCSASYCDPDRVKLRYLAGYPLEGRQMAVKFRSPMVWLAAAELKRRICACRETNEKLYELQQDLTLESTQTERYTVAPEDLRNPFGTRRGHVQAWRALQDELLRRGISA